MGRVELSTTKSTKPTKAAKFSHCSAYEYREVLLFRAFRVFRDFVVIASERLCTWRPIFFDSFSARGV
jgi:hypothetical protein